jgi:DNA-binding NtrC family response regulator
MKPSNPVVLYVDSDARATAEFLQLTRGWPIEVQLAPSVAEAAEILGSEPVALVIADHGLEDLPGLAFLATVRCMFPEASVVLYTAETQHGNWSVDVPVLFRPCEPALLKELVLSTVAPKVPRRLLSVA